MDPFQELINSSKKLKPVVDNNKTSRWFSITAFSESEMSKLETAPFPHFVKAVYGGREKCPDTGRIHHQAAINTWTPQRWTVFKEWLPTAHIECAYKNPDALIEYVMKKETATGEKKVINNSIPHFGAKDICLLLARHDKIHSGVTVTDPFWTAANKILEGCPDLAGQLMNPSLRGFYNKSRAVWIKKAHIVLREPAQPLPPGVERPCLNGDDCCRYHEPGQHRDECFVCHNCDPFENNCDCSDCNK